MTLAEQLTAFPLLHAETSLGRIAYRCSDTGSGSGSARNVPSLPPLVLLHGIGSASASWLKQLQKLSNRYTVLAWNAPGYTESSALPMAVPTAADYAERMWAWLDALGIDRITLAGHSLGALMAGAATRIRPQRVERLCLFAPAGGYGKAEAALRETKLRERLTTLKTLGPHGMAEKRGAALLSPTAPPEEVALIQSVMAEIDPAGYTQAVHMLMYGDLAADLSQVSCPITVASGNADTITPPAACQAIAASARTRWNDLGPVGHACPLEAAAAVNRVLMGAET